MGKNKQQLTNEVNTKEITDAVKRNEEAEFASEFPLQKPEKGTNQRPQRQKKQ